MENNLFSILRYHIIDKALRMHGQVSSNDLINAFRDYSMDDIPEKTILQDIEIMKSDSEYGYRAPIKFSKEKKLFYYSDTSFSLQKTALNKDEKRTLIWVINYLDLIKENKSLRGLKGLIQKLVDTIQIREHHKDLELPDFVNAELAAEYGGSKYISPLIKAITNKKVVRLYYLPFYEDKPYFINVHPYLLKEYKGRWYLIGLNETKKEIRTYGLERVWELEETEKPYIQKDFSAAEYFKNTVGIISPIGEPPFIQVEVSIHQAKYLITQPLHESQYIEKEDENYVVFNYKVHPTYEFKSLILALGKDVRVLKPESFKREIIHELNETILAYGKG